MQDNTTRGAGRYGTLMFPEGQSAVQVQDVYTSKSKALIMGAMKP